jgi:hypothetical protein
MADSAPRRDGSGGTALLEDGALHLTFQRIIEDSRCPAGVSCFWQGRVLLTLGVVVDGEDVGEVLVTTYVLTGQGPDTLDVAVGAYAVRLLGMRPAPVYGESRDPGSFVATLRVTKP